MELYDERRDERQSKAPKIIWFCIIVLIMLTIAIVIGIFYLKSSITTININGVRNTEIEKIFYFEAAEDGGKKGKKLYMPIIRTAKFLGYEGFNGDYYIKSEDKTECYVTCEDEVAMFTKDSEMLVKVAKDSESEYIQLDQPVFELNGELYTTIKGIEKAFNVLFVHDAEFKNVNIYSMDVLVESYATKLKIEKYSKNFVDHKAIFENMIIVSSNKQYGVVNSKTGEAILEAKYESISYLPTTKEFLVKSNGQYGVVTKDAEIVIKTIYDEIKSMDNKNGLYLVKQNGSYGVIDTKGNIIIEPEYKQIGINVNKYAQNGVENKYVLLNDIIPIKDETGLWALFNIKGDKITDFKYTGFGCTTTPAANSYPALVIPSYKIIVAQADKKYVLVTTEGEEMTPANVIDSVYLKADSTTGENKFFMTNTNGKTLGVEDWLINMGQ